MGPRMTIHCIYILSRINFCLNQGSATTESEYNIKNDKLIHSVRLNKSDWYFLFYLSL